MKYPRIYFLIAWLLIASCNNLSSPKLSQQDSAASSKPVIDDIEMQQVDKTDSLTTHAISPLINAEMEQIPVIIASGQNAAMQETVIVPDHLVLTDGLAKKFKPREIYLEILRRKGQIKNDTTLPAHQRPYYSQQEISVIIQKNEPLRKLSEKDLYRTYEKSGILRHKDVIYETNDMEEVQYNADNLSANTANRPDMDDAKCVVAIIPRKYLNRDGNGNYVINNPPTLHEQHNICLVPQEKFIMQPAIAHCSGFAVSTTKMMTAGHSGLDNNNFKGFYYVFDYIVGTGNVPKKVLPASTVYEGTKIDPHYDPDKGMDFSFITLNRPIDPRRLRKFESASALDKNVLYHVIGCPGGIPLKLSPNAKILDNSHPTYFTINSDTYECNSGSPVFNSKTQAIEGVLISGGNDYEESTLNPDCRVSATCPIDGCAGPDKGEHVLRTKQFLHLIK